MIQGRNNQLNIFENACRDGSPVHAQNRPHRKLRFHSRQESLLLKNPSHFKLIPLFWKINPVKAGHLSVTQDNIHLTLGRKWQQDPSVRVSSVVFTAEPDRSFLHKRILFIEHRNQLTARCRFRQVLEFAFTNEGTRTDSIPDELDYPDTSAILQCIKGEGLPMPQNGSVIIAVGLLLIGNKAIKL